MYNEKFATPIRIAIICLSIWLGTVAIQNGVITYRAYSQVELIAASNQQLQAQLQATVKQANEEIAKRDAEIARLTVE